MSLEPQECRYGYPIEQLRRELGGRIDAYTDWARGSTGAICDGQEWEPATGRFVKTGCGPHGMVVYRRDVRRFLAGLPPDD